MKSSHPIATPVHNPDQINDLFDSISYFKVSVMTELILSFKDEWSRFVASCVDLIVSFRIDKYALFSMFPFVSKSLISIHVMYNFCCKTIWIFKLCVFMIKWHRELMLSFFNIFKNRSFSSGNPVSLPSFFVLLFLHHKLILPYILTPKYFWHIYINIMTIMCVLTKTFDFYQPLIRKYMYFNSIPVLLM